MSGLTHGSGPRMDVVAFTGRMRVSKDPSNSWDALLEDAKARNKAFFDRAGISGKNLFSNA